MTTNKKQTGSKKNKAVRFVLIGAGVAGLLTAGYFTIQYLRSRKSGSVDNDYPEPPDVDIPKLPPPAPAPRTPAPARNDEFPLKRGSRGGRVKTLQEALIVQYGKSVLPKYGADGDFGKETEDALKAKQLPASIDESTFNVITRQSSTAPDKLATEIYTALQSKNFDKTVSGLKKIRNKDEYVQVSAVFKTYFLRGVRQTLVNGALGTFENESQKQQLRLEFLRMGLRYDGNKWSLDGLSGAQLITIKPARVWKDQKRYVNVPARTVLGTEVKRKGRFAVFEHKGKYFLVLTGQVQYL